MKRNIKLQAFCMATATLMAGCSKNQVSSKSATEQGTTVSTALKTETYTQECTKDKTIDAGASYKMNNNIWGAGTDGAGTQCIWWDSVSQTWGCNASHTSGSAKNIKGYPALVRGWLWYNSSGVIWAKSPTADPSFPVQMSHLASFNSNWTMTVPNNGEKYDSSYDIWLDTQNNPNYKPQYEVMIWLNFKGPAYSSTTDFTPFGSKIHSNISIAGATWDIWSGYNGTNNVYSFRRTTNTSSVSNLDIKAFLTYAQNDGFIQSSYYLLGVQAGWEIVAGGAFSTNSYTTTIVKN